MMKKHKFQKKTGNSKIPVNNRREKINRLLFGEDAEMGETITEEEQEELEEILSEIEYNKTHHDMCDPDGNSIADMLCEGFIKQRLSLPVIK